MGNFTAFLDASVLYPAAPRDLLLELAVADYLDTLRAQGLLATFKAIEPFDQFI